MRQSACIVIIPITVDNFVALFKCTMVDRASRDGPDLNLFSLVDWDRSSFVSCLVHRGSTDDLLLLQISSGVIWQTRDLHLSCNMLSLLIHPLSKCDLFVYCDDSLTS